jgi:hypothetical protein
LKGRDRLWEAVARWGFNGRQQMFGHVSRGGSPFPGRDVLGKEPGEKWGLGGVNGGYVLIPRPLLRLVIIAHCVLNGRISLDQRFRN